GVFNTLRGAVCAANDGDTIVFQLPEPQKIITLNAPLVLNKNLTINGTDQNVILSGESVNNAIELNDKTIQLLNLSITKAQKNGVFVNGATAIVNKVRLTQNKENGINLDGNATITVIYSEISGNEKNGIYAMGNPNLQLIESIVTENQE